MNVIGFIGSVFSPWFEWSGRKNPANNSCMHVATHGPGARWAMTDRGEHRLRRSADKIDIGPSSMEWDGEALTIHVDERAWPTGGRIRGTVRVIPQAVTNVELPLSPDGAHVWRPVAPTSRVEVRLGKHGEWDGHGYLDSNFGTRALERDFAFWTWGRYPDGKGGTVCFYDVEWRDGRRQDFGARFSPDGSAELLPELPPKVPMARSKWLVRRETRGDAGTRAVQTRAMLDSPFYTRAAVRTTLDGEVLEGVHEALDLRRFRSPLMKPMLMMKVPRRPRGD